MKSIPSVVMKLGMPKDSEIAPFKTPTTTQTMSAAAKQIQNDRPVCCESAQSTIGARPKTDPIERSNSPAIMRRPKPNAMIDSSGNRPRMPRRF